MARTLNKTLGNQISLGPNCVAARLAGASAISFAAISAHISASSGAANYNRVITCSITTGNAGMTLSIEWVGEIPVWRTGWRSTSGDAFQAVNGVSTVTTSLTAAGAVADFAAKKIRLYVDGVLDMEANATFGASVFTPGTPTDNDWIGGNNTVVNLINGTVGEVCFWKGDIGAEGFLAHAWGVTPYQNRPDLAALYFPLSAETFPEVDPISGKTASLVGTVPMGQHPRIFLPHGSTIRYGAKGPSTQTRTSVAVGTTWGVPFINIATPDDLILRSMSGVGLFWLRGGIWAPSVLDSTEARDFLLGLFVLEGGGIPPQFAASTAVAVPWVTVAATASVGPASGLTVPAIATWETTLALTSAGPVSCTSVPSIATWVAPPATASAAGLTATSIVTSYSWLAIPGATTTPGARTATTTPAIATWTTTVATAYSAGAVVTTAAIATWVTPAALATAGPRPSTSSPSVATWVAPAATSTPGARPAASTASVAVWVSVTALATTSAVEASSTPAIVVWGTLAATAATGLAHLELEAEPFQLDLTVQDAVLVYNRVLIADPVQLSLTVDAITLSYGRFIDAAPVSVTISTVDAALIYNRIFPADSTRLDLQVSDAQLVFRRSEVGWDTLLHPPIDGCREELVGAVHAESPAVTFGAEALHPPVKGEPQRLSNATHPKANVAQPLPTHRRNC